MYDKLQHILTFEKPEPEKHFAFLLIVSVLTMVSSEHTLLLFVECFVSQTRSLLSVFEEDAGMLTDYTNQLLQSMQRVFGAQVLNKTQAHTHMPFS